MGISRHYGVRQSCIMKQALRCQDITSMLTHVAAGTSARDTVM
jgi:hypothetical protein